MGGGVDAEHRGSWRPPARALGVGREASHVSTLTLPSCPRLDNRPPAVGVSRVFVAFGVAARHALGGLGLSPTVFLLRLAELVQPPRRAHPDLDGIDPCVDTPICFSCVAGVVPKFLYGAREEGVERCGGHDNGQSSIFHRPQPPNPRTKGWAERVNGWLSLGGRKYPVIETSGTWIQRRRQLRRPKREMRGSATFNGLWLCREKGPQVAFR